MLSVVILTPLALHVPVDMAILDFSEAFDGVPHKRLLGKLSLYGINGPILCWTEAFLTDQVQGVVVEGFRSPEGNGMVY